MNVNSRMDFLSRGNFRFTWKERRLIFGDLARPSRGRSYLHLAWRRSQWNQAIGEGRTNSLRGPLFETQRNISDRTRLLLVPPSLLILPLGTACLRFSFPIVRKNWSPFSLGLMNRTVDLKRLKIYIILSCWYIIFCAKISYVLNIWKSREHEL